MVHDIAWTHDSNYFIVISGLPPSTATLFDQTCSPLFEFGKRYRNTIRICPFSSCVLIGGFGNLAGEVDFWHMGSMTELKSTKAHCTVGVEWAPNGRFLMTSVLNPRMKMDNEIKIWSANGQQLCSKSYHASELYDV
jgi:translation initiation factor 2A